MPRVLINGVPNVFGAPTDPVGIPVKLNGTGQAEQDLMIDFSFDNLPAGSAVATGDAGILVIPKASFIVSARLEVITAFVGGTSYDIGLVDAADGTTAIGGANGLFSALALASINGAGKWAVGAGALVGAVSSTTQQAQIKVTATGSFTAGRAKLYVKYIPSSQFS